ncbi:uncharacterized protein C8R40DRAFT_1126059 [Lentinula edodes]|uniref:uncharacterized protein n=1 Tax=Lentinula edodes TaxID=5353 RepID=UPI001E8D5F28|nr:uncharacterized protein C8R40DRAFT_1126059 [Lentinula edodes]KAH7870504.1 hypothetical protein C8R40DRAFT_1126059 [Lentinula edodes]
MFVPKLALRQRKSIYDVGRKFFTIVGVASLPGSFIVNAPFGRFTPRSPFLTIDGRLGWVLMELWSPLGFIYAMFNSPLSEESPRFSMPQIVLVSCFMVHYLNRGFLSPARAPSRSRMHVFMPLTGLILNTTNGGLIGSYISSPIAFQHLQPETAFSSPQFYIGVFLWAVGFLGNFWADEILSDIRKKGALRGKEKKLSSGAEYYGIPHGFLYRWISFPNYLCEWVEMLGWALAASPIPKLTDLEWLLSVNGIYTMAFTTPPSQFAPTLTPPWIFLIVELCLMLPRAYKGHQWYKEKFGDAFPKERRAVIPYVF